ncbi:hypothetical protein ZOSMA_148G00200 [Zostera marina]|uniref:Uncharacterized protein n=1 Tax=Zostera marina TaxID=29655 RepID=A0A0K9PZ07_ZOSMR|nr:hypothetical protein ZOSMA_148G00200 [Zostera marina]
MATATAVVHPIHFQIHNRPRFQTHHISLPKSPLRGSTLLRRASPPAEGTTTPPSDASQLSGCTTCGKQDLEKGCSGEGRIQGGIATIPGFGWWPIKAYRPCPGLVELGGRYKRYGQSLDEIVGRSDRSK